MFDFMINLLTDNYNKSPSSNIGKLFKLIADELQEVRSNLEKIEEYRDVDKATGHTLDKIGGNVKQYRGASTDEIYRILIKSKIARNMSTGDINTIIRIVSQTINSDYSDIQIVEMYNDDESPEAAAIKLLEIPLSKINEVGMSSSQFGRMIERTLPGGISLKEIRMEGTFEFGNIDDFIDNERGFGDVTNQAIGGILGATYSPMEDRELPL